jgi:hypothetical protein
VADSSEEAQVITTIYLDDSQPAMVLIPDEEEEDSLVSWDSTRSEDCEV